MERLIKRIHDKLTVNFVGVNVTYKNNAYDKITTIIPICNVEVTKTSETEDLVSIDLGSIKCSYNFIWQTNQVASKSTIYRLNKIEPVREEYIPEEKK